MNSEDKLLLAKVYDSINAAKNKNHIKYIGFLNLHEISVVKKAVEQQFIKHKFWGGYENAERLIFVAIPDFTEQNDLTFPISAITFKYKVDFKLKHRDFLGTFMSLGIKRSKIGDIIVNDGITVALVHNDILDYLITQITTIGGVGVKVEIGFNDNLIANEKHDMLRYTVSSNRLDCIVAAILKCSRSKATAIIVSGKVFLNDIEALVVDKRIESGSRLSIRSVGKFIIDCVDEVTKKGRVVLKARKKL